MEKSSVIIIGAGAAGLMAAMQLAPDYAVTILEAKERIGGRIFTLEKQGMMIEAGAEFVHGNLPLTLGLLKEAGIHYLKVSGSQYRKKKNGGFNEAEDNTVNWDELLEKMQALPQDMTMQEFLDNYFAGAANETLRKQVSAFAEGFDVADTSKVSMKTLMQEWSTEEDDNYRIPTGYSSLMNYLRDRVLKQAGTILYNSIVASVFWRKGRVVVKTSNGTEYRANKLLVTVPVSVLRQPVTAASIRFDPAIDFSDTVAGTVGFGSVVKIVLAFENAFWQQDAGFILSDESIPTWWTQLPDRRPLLTGWIGGPRAAKMAGEPATDIIDRSLASLASIYGTDVTTLKRSLQLAEVFNWSEDAFALGAYSYPTVQSRTAKNDLYHPLDGTIFFAGEGLYAGEHFGTVEAALTTGLEAARLIK